MSTSVHDGRIRFQSSQIGADEPFDASQAQILANNILHHADGAGQVRIAWCGVAANDVIAQNATGAGVGADEWFRVAQFGPFPMFLKASGRPYKARCYAYIENNKVASPGPGSTIRIVWMSSFGDGKFYAEENGDNVQNATHDSTTGAWVGTKTELVFPDEDVSASLRTVNANMSISADPGGVAVPMGYVEVWGQSSDTAQLVEVGGLYLAEYIG